MDETHIKRNGTWVYLYRAIDWHGHTIDFLLRQKRYAATAKSFFQREMRHNGEPEKMTLDKNPINKATVTNLNTSRTERRILKRSIKSLNNLVEQDHRLIKTHTKSMLGFRNFHAAQRTIAGMKSVRMIQKGQIQGFDKTLSTFHNFARLMETCA